MCEYYILSDLYLSHLIYLFLYYRRRIIMEKKLISEKVQMEAVKQNGYAIEFIDNPSEEVQLAAVKENGRSIKYIKNPSEQAQLEAVEQDIYNILANNLDKPYDEIVTLCDRNNWFIGQEAVDLGIADKVLSKEK